MEQSRHRRHTELFGFFRRHMTRNSRAAMSADDALPGIRGIALAIELHEGAQQRLVIFPPMR